MNQTRGSGGFFEGNDANLQSYTDYQRSTGSDVVTTNIPLTPEQERAAIERAIEQGDPGPPFCADSVSSALSGMCGIDHTMWPGSLNDEARSCH